MLAEWMSILTCRDKKCLFTDSKFLWFEYLQSIFDFDSSFFKFKISSSVCDRSTGYVKILNDSIKMNYFIICLKKKKRCLNDLFLPFLGGSEYTLF